MEILSAFILIFIAEMGDKSQIVTMTLSMKYASPIIVLTGTILGIICANILAIIVGIIMGKTIPRKLLNWISAIIFFYFRNILALEQFNIYGQLTLYWRITITKKLRSVINYE